MGGNPGAFGSVPAAMTVRSPFLRWLSFVALVLAISQPGLLRADVTDDYLLDVWNSENGLPDSSVTAIAQTPDGYLWLGTYNGLARFDGVRFTSFDPANTPALAHARIRRLSVDSRGTLWVSTYDGSLTKFANGAFSLERRNTRSSEADVAYVSSTSNQVVFLTSRGELLRKQVDAPPGDGWEELPAPARGIGAVCCEDGAGTLWYRDGDRHLWRFKGNGFESLPDSAGLAGQNVNCLATDSQGRLWVGTDFGIAIWNGTRFQSALPAESNAPLDVECLAVSADGHAWMVANGCIAELFDRHWLLTPEPPRNVFAGAIGRVSAQDDHRGGMWFYNYGRGLLHVGSSGTMRPLTIDDGFPGDRVYCYWEDREGDWWAGLDAAGLVRVRPRQFHAVFPADKSLPTAARSVCEDPHGNVWIGRLSDGLGCWDNGSVKDIDLTRDAGGDSVFCVCPGLDGKIWMSGGDEDLFVGENGDFRRVTPLVHGVKAICADHAGHIWVGTTSGLLVSEDGLPENLQPLKGFPRRTVRALTEDKDDNIWGGTGSGDLFCIANHTATMFHPTDNQDSGAVWSVLADDDGTKWVGTFRGGLLRFRDGQFTRYGKAQGLPDNVICQILDDGRGNLWIGSHQGVFSVAKSALNAAALTEGGFVPCITFGRSDGMPSQECSGGYQPAAWRDHAGRLWFTTAKGAAWVQPDDIKRNLNPPPVVIEEILVDGRREDVPESGTMDIPPGRHQIELHYAGLSLASPERVQFRYRLVNLDADWIQAGSRRTAQYSFLAPGKYRFEVIACNSDGVWNETGSSLALTIQPHFYETWWFRALAAMIILGSVAAIVRFAATRRLHQRMEQLERRQAIERERARIAKDIHDDLGASLTLIAVLGDLAKKEKTWERIEKMSGTARDAVKSLDEIVWAVNPRNDTLSHLIDYMGQFATGYLRDAGIRCLLDVPDHPPVQEVPANVRHNVFLVVKEALQNIVKHAHATEVWLRVNTGGADLTVSVEDNGCGFNGAPEDAWADGLRNMRQRLSEVGGECQITSRVNAGTAILLHVRLPGEPQTFIR
jgi:ligand-binding sensor domain-containing protein/signal transduction histidine kinase